MIRGIATISSVGWFSVIRGMTRGRTNRFTNVLAGRQRNSMSRTANTGFSPSPTTVNGRS